ncbi:MAG: multicopper oxidase domain-containing protein [Thiolinea sp.]
MQRLENAKLSFTISSLLLLALLASCDKKPSAPLCSTLTETKTKNCSFVSNSDDGPTVLDYSLTASRQTLNVPVANGSKPALKLHDALVYNGSLLPERLELRRGDELRIKLLNQLTLPEDGRFNSLGTPSMRPWLSNLHTHGLVTAWDFKAEASPAARGDNVLGVLLDSKRQTLPAGIDPKSICTTNGDNTSYRYPIRADHELGLNWYHPHPHGVSGFQVEGGLSGLLVVGDAQAEQQLHPVYIQLKDMQTSKLSEGAYRFEKFEPPIASICHDKTSDDEWAFDTDAVGRCEYHKKNTGLNYAWLFLVNGELFPTIELPQQAYLRLANNSANATYRLVLEPEAVQQQAANTTVTYYVPPFKVIEKDGMTTLEASITDRQTACSLAMTPATRVGVSIGFADLLTTDTACALTVNVKQDKTGIKTTQYTVEKIQLDAKAKQLAAQAATQTYSLTQEGIDTGEDDWPSVRLAKLVVNAGLPNTNLAKYQELLKVADQAIKVTERTDIKAPDDACEPSIPMADADGINRHLAVFYGGTGRQADGSFDQEHFGLLAAGEMNEGQPVDLSTIEAWRAEYQRQFADKALAKAEFNLDKKLQEYNPPNLDELALKGLVTHKFEVALDGKVKANICTSIHPQPEHWRIHNLSAQIHNFHLHQMKFHVLAVRGATCSLPQATDEAQAFKLVDAQTGYLPANIDTASLAQNSDEQCVKSYAELFYNVPASFKLVQAPVSTAPARTTEVAPSLMAKDYGMHDTFPVPPMGYIDIEVPFTKPEHVGEYVFHCHILEHEDAGMMGKVVVKP